MTSLVVIGVLTVVMVLLYLTLLLDDAAITWLIREDHPIELAGALSLLAASIACVLLWRRVQGDVRWPRLRRLSLLVLAAAFFFGFGEEISWGERILGFTPPESVEEANRQGEFNVHNLELFAGGLNADGLFQLFWLVLGVIIPIVALSERARRLLRRAVPILPLALAPLFLLNQLLTLAFKNLFSWKPGLYNSSVFTDPGHPIFEVKEAVASLLLAVGFWMLVRGWRREA